jgi:hypothetical protein
MTDTRLLMIARCPECRARVRLDGDAARDLAKGRDQTARCHACRTVFAVSPDGTTTPAAPNEPGPATPPPAVPLRAEPPFRDLVNPATDAPPFGPLDEPQPEEPTTWWARQSRRWNALPPARRRLYTGLGVVAVAAAIMAWPMPAPAEAPAPSATADATKVIEIEKKVFVPVPTPTFPVLHARKPIPINLKVTRKNFDEYFEVRRVDVRAADSLGSPDQVIDKFARRAHNATEQITRNSFGSEIVPDPEWIKVHRQDILSGNTPSTVYWVYVAPGEPAVKVLDPNRVEPMRVAAAKALHPRILHGERFPGIDLTP